VLCALCCACDYLGSEFIDEFLVLEIPDADGWSGCYAEPVPVGREAQGVDHWVVLSLGQIVQMLALIQVPEKSMAVLATGSAEGAVGRNGDGV